MAVVGPLVLVVGWYSWVKAFRYPPERDLVLEVGPVDLPASSTHEGAMQPLPTRHVLEQNGWLHGFRIELVDAGGHRVPSELLHHVKVVSMNRRELFHPIMLRVIGAGAETQPPALPRALGYPLHEGDTLLITAMLHNPGSRAYGDVRVRVIGRFTPSAGRPEPFEVFPFFTHVTAPDSTSSYDLPPGRSERSRLIQPAIGGRVIGLGGHLHRYGVELTLEDITTGELLWKSEAVRDSAGNVLEVPVRFFLWRGGLPLRSDRVYRMTGVYFNPTGDTIRGGGMATMGGALRPHAGAAWPALDRQHPIYLLDLARELGTAPGGQHVHAGHHD
jgi:hypothetical protein